MVNQQQGLQGSQRSIRKSDISSPKPLFHASSLPPHLQQTSSTTGKGPLPSPMTQQRLNVSYADSEYTPAEGRVQSTGAGVPLGPSASMTSFQRAQYQQQQSHQMRPFSQSQYQTLVQGLMGFKRQLLAFSAATQAFSRELQTLQDSTAQPLPSLELLIDSISLLSNNQMAWAEQIESHVEQPLLKNMTHIHSTSQNTAALNKQKIQTLTMMLQKEEDASYKLGKKKQRDLATLQSSLAKRMQISNEINRLQHESKNMADYLTQNQLPSIVQTLARAIRFQMEHFEHVQEGLVKLGADSYVPSESEGLPSLDSVSSSSPSLRRTPTTYNEEDDDEVERLTDMGGKLSVKDL